MPCMTISVSARATRLKCVFSAASYAPRSERTVKLWCQIRMLIGLPGSRRLEVHVGAVGSAAEAAAPADRVAVFLLGMGTAAILQQHHLEVAVVIVTHGRL